MTYHRKFFSPSEDEGQKPACKIDDSIVDARPVYVYTDPIVLAVNVALATERPLLVTGPPGSGKSTLARHVAKVKGWRYIKAVVTSGTKAEDLLWGFDALRRLNDAQLRDQTLLPEKAYIEPGKIWWAFDPDSALRRGTSRKELGPSLEKRFLLADDPSIGKGPDCVLLLDEIDKADPDVPNDLLEPLDRKSFSVRHLKDPVTAKGSVLVIITTNGERELPPAFLRRCVSLTLEAMSRDRLIAIAKRHFGSDPGDLYEPIADWLLASQERARQLGLREPSTAEFLDTVRACSKLSKEAGAETWKEVAKLSMWKHEAEAPQWG